MQKKVFFLLFLAITAVFAGTIDDDVTSFLDNLDSDPVQCWGSSVNDIENEPDHDFVIIDADAAGDFACGLKSDGTPYCWGDDSSDQVSDTPTSTGRFKAIAVGGDHVCALTALGSVVCWGSDSVGQTDDGDAPTLSHIAAGEDFTCGIATVDASIVCWGDDTSDQLNAPTRVGGYSQLSLGDTFSCARDSVGDVDCWGGGTDSDFNDDVPTGRVTDISAGASHVCAILAGGSLDCWGSDASGVISETPDDDGNYRDIASGNSFSCAINDDRTVTCWGINTSSVLDDIPNKKFDSITAGSTFACGLVRGGSSAAARPVGVFSSLFN